MKPKIILVKQMLPWRMKQEPIELKDLKVYLNHSLKIKGINY